MKSRPILFSGPMVQAILDGRKSQTRRVVKPQPKFQGIESFGESWEWRKGEDWFSGVTTKQLAGHTGLLYPARCPFATGDRLWVRENWAECTDDKGLSSVAYQAGEMRHLLCADGGEGDPVGLAKEVECKPLYAPKKWKPSIFMPRWASRILLEVVSVRVERVQDIGKDGRKAKDVLAEGITDAQIEHWRKWLHPDDAPAHTYAVLWNSINSKRGFGWEKNPWVWVIEFKRI